MELERIQQDKPIAARFLYPFSDGTIARPTKLDIVISDTEGYSDDPQNEETSTTKPKGYTIIIEDGRQQFDVHDLKTIEYFRKLLANPWRGQEMRVEFNEEEAHKFGVQELQVIIDSKHYREISSDYPCSRISNLLNALDFFQESIDHNLFYQYLSNYFPVIDPLKSIITDGAVENAEFTKAMTMYKRTYHYLGMKIGSKFINNWQTVNVNILANMSNISYMILLKTLKLIKIEQDSRLRDSSAAYDRDCVLLIEFIQHRGWADFERLWKSVLRSDNYVHIFHLLSVVVSQYFKRKDYEEALEFGGLLGDKHIHNPHDIGHLCKQMIKRVAYKIFYEKRKLDPEMFTDFQQIIIRYIKITKIMENEQVIDQFYAKLVGKYFEAHKRIHPSILILFNPTYFNPDIFQRKYDKMSDNKKEKMLQGLFSLLMIQNYSQYETVYAFFMTLNKVKTFEYIDQHLSNTNLIANDSFTALLIAFKDILEMDDETDLLDKFYETLIDLHLFESFGNVSLWRLILDTFDENTIHHRFELIKKKKQISFLKHLLESGENGKIAPKQLKLGKHLLDKNLNVAIDTFHVWFPMLMIEEEQWIIDTFLNEKWLSFMELEKVLNVISDSFLTDRDENIPQQYFDFVNKYTSFDL